MTGEWSTDPAYRSRLMAWARNASPLQEIPDTERGCLDRLQQYGRLKAFWKAFPTYVKPDMLEGGRALR